MAPIYSVKVLGWEKDVYSGWVSQSNLVAGILGLLFVGFIAERWGPRRVFILVMISITAIALTMLVLQPQWGAGLILIGFIFVFKSVNTLRLATGGAVAMTLCTPAVAASQYTLLVAFINFGNMAASASLGWLDSLGGIPAMFAAMAMCGIVGAAFAIAAKVGR